MENVDNVGWQEFVSKRTLKNEKAKEIAEQKKSSTSKCFVRQSNRGRVQGSFVSKGNLKKMENTIADKNKPPKQSTFKSDGIETKSKFVGSQVKKSDGYNYVVGRFYSSVVVSLSKSEKPAKSTSVSQEQISPLNVNGNDKEENKSSSSGLGDDRINQSDGQLGILQAEAEEGIDNVTEDHRPPSGDSGVSCTGSSFLPLLPLPLQQINLFGFNYPLQCTNYVNEYLSSQLNNHENDIFVNGQKVYEHPDEFIRDAKKFFNVANRILTCECCWGAFSLAVKLLFKDLKINFSTHNAGFKLALLGARFSPEGPFLGSVVTLMNRDHQNFYSGVASRDEVFEFIDNVAEFAYYFGLINAVDVWNSLKNYLPTEPGATSFYRGITFEKKNKFTDGIFGRIFEFEYTAYIPRI